jgi:hypothetical protein
MVRSDLTHRDPATACLLSAIIREIENFTFALPPYQIQVHFLAEDFSGKEAELFFYKLIEVFGFAGAGAVLLWIASHKSNASEKKGYWIGAGACFVLWIFVLSLLSA